MAALAQDAPGRPLGAGVVPETTGAVRRAPSLRYAVITNRLRRPERRGSQEAPRQPVGASATAALVATTEVLGVGDEA